MFRRVVDCGLIAGLLYWIYSSYSAPIPGELVHFNGFIIGGFDKDICRWIYSLSFKAVFFPRLLPIAMSSTCLELRVVVLRDPIREMRDWGFGKFPRKPKVWTRERPTA